MHYLFSNVLRPAGEAAYKRTLSEKIDLSSDRNVLVFFNSCAPLLRFKNLFSLSSVMLVSRIDSIHGGTAQGGDSWISALEVRCRRLNVFHVDDHGQFYDASYRKTVKIALEGYPRESPTSGFMAWKLLSMEGNDVSLVNFYGMDDLSTPMYEGHDYAYENRILREKAKMIFLED